MSFVAILIPEHGKASSMAEHVGQLYPYPGSVKSNVWKYFMFEKKEGVIGPASKSNLDMTTVVCTICKKKYANKGNTTNLQFHLDTHHKELMGAVNETQAKQQPKIFTNLSPSPVRFSRNKQDEIDDALMQMMVGKILPTSLVENEYFLKFVSLLDSRYKVPDRKKLVKGLEKKKINIQQKIQAELATCHDVAITHDGWTSCSTESYSTVTGHYIDKNWVLKSVSLSTTKVEGSHTSENIAKQIETVTTNWNLPKCIAVSDNAANERKAFELLNWIRFGCFGHRINLIVRHSLAESTVSRLIGKGRKLVTFYHQSSSATDMLIEKQRLLYPDETPLRLLQDVVTRWNSTYSMLQRINKLLPAVVATANDDKLSKYASTSIKSYTYNFEEQHLAEKLVVLLEPFQNATQSVSAESKPTLHLVMPILVALKQILTLQEDDPVAIKSVKTKMNSELEKRTQGQDHGLDLALLACVLNPFTKNLKFLGPEDQARAVNLLEEKALEVFPEVAAAIKIKQEPSEKHGNESDLPQLPVAPAGLEEETLVTPGPSTESLSVEESDAEPLVKKVKIEKSESSMGRQDDWLHDVLFIGESEEPTVSTIKQEVARYMGSAIQYEERKLSILEWWKTNELFYPRLNVLAKKYLSIPASSIPSERIFSLCGNIVSKKRSRLSPDHVDLFVFLKMNMKGFW